MESPSESDIANYRSWRRKLRRRLPFPAFLIGIYALMLVFYLLRTAAILALLWREHQSFAAFATYAWWILLLSALFEVVFLLVIGCFDAWVRQQGAASPKSDAARKPVPVYSRITGFVVPSFVIVALLANQIDIAIVTFFVSNGVSRFSKAFRFKQRRYAAYGLFSM